MGDAKKLNDVHHCHTEAATDGAREASQSRASDSPVPGEHRDVRTARPDEEHRSPVPADRWGPREPNETHHGANDARVKGSTGRDSRFGLARPVPNTTPS